MTVRFNVPDGREWSFGSLLSVANTKTQKSVKAVGVLTGIMHLAPHTRSVQYGGVNVCPFAGQCAANCLETAGRLRFSSAEQARIARTLFYVHRRNDFYVLLTREIDQLRRKAEAEGLKPAVRLNGLSDIDWPHWLFREHPDVEFYDYTKDIRRCFASLSYWWAKNYTLVYSWNEKSNPAEVEEWLRKGGRVAVVFLGEKPSKWRRFPVVDADAHDFLPAWPKSCVLGLKAKGSLRKAMRGVAWLGDWW